MAALVPLLLMTSGPSPTFLAVGAAGECPVGSLVRLTADGSAEVATPSGPKALPHIISLRRTNVPLPPVSRGPVLLTTTGDRIPGRITGGDGRALRFRANVLTAEQPDWKVPLSCVSIVWLTTPVAAMPLDPQRYSWLGDTRRKDFVLLRNGDIAHGTLLSFTPDIRLRSENGAVRTFALVEPAALAFDPSLARTRMPTSPYAHVALRDGTRLNLTGTTIADGTLRGKSLFGAEVELSLLEVVGFDVYRGKAAYLSDLKPKRADYGAFLGVEWPWAADRTVRGESLRLIGPNGMETFDKGIGTHPRTVLSYDLAGKYRRFEALVGLDAVSGLRGRAVVRVLVDDRDATPTALRKPIAGLAVPVRIDVTGAKELTLEVDFGPTGDVQADVNWADARVVE